MPTAYEVLGVPEGALAVEVDRAYREAVLRHHPDRGGCAKDLDLAVRAGRILRDPERRAAYDARLRARRRGPGPEPPRESAEAPLRRAERVVRGSRRVTAEDVLAALRFASDVVREIRKIRGGSQG